MPRPRELSAIQAVLLLACVAAAIAVLLLADAYAVRLATRAIVFALAASALDLALGVGGMVSFGHAAFLGLGAYVVGIAFVHGFEGSTLLGLAPPSDIWRQILLATGVAGLFAAATGWVCLRTRGVAFIMITLAFAQMLFYFFVSLRRYNGEDGIALWNRSDGIVLDLADDRTFFLFCLGWLVLFLTFAGRLYHSRFGRVVRAIRDNERRTRALGYPVVRFKLVTYVLSAAATAVAGVLLANATWFVGPSFLSWPVSGQLIVMVVLGGIGTIYGPALGAVVFILLEEFLPDALDLLLPGAGEHWKIVLGPLLVVVALLAHRGLFGASGHLRKPRLAAAAGAGAVRDD